MGVSSQIKWTLGVGEWRGCFISRELWRQQNKVSLWADNTGGVHNLYDKSKQTMADQEVEVNKMLQSFPPFIDLSKFSDP